MREPIGIGIGARERVVGAVSNGLFTVVVSNNVLVGGGVCLN